MILTKNLERLNDTTDFPVLKTSLVFRCGNANTFPAPFDSGQDSCGCEYVHYHLEPVCLQISRF